ncbi:aminotransferase class I/II-fold pyridoxal phosphate-dependent enzyme [Patescibacteria group bacterium]|nr:aminotransferase class I/II-fold pyridoxal phosphate-dependent enzyme [Patescibacteria group bacterium]
MVKSSGLELVGYGPQFTNVVVLADRARIPYMAVQSPLLEPIEVKISDLCDYLQRRKGLAVVYVDNPNNPTGDVINGESLKALVMLTQKRGDLLIVDEAFGDSILDGMSAFGLMENANNMIVTRSLSKVIGLASPRLGYMAMSRPLAEVYKNIELVFSVDTFTGLVGEVALEPVMLAEFLPDVRKKTELIKRQMVRVLQEVGIDVFESHPMVSILLARGEGNFYKTLLDLGIGTEDGATFKPTHENMDSSLVRMRIPGSLGRVAEIRKRLEKI